MFLSCMEVNTVTPFLGRLLINDGPLNLHNKGIIAGQGAFVDRFYRISVKM